MRDEGHDRVIYIFCDKAFSQASMRSALRGGSWRLFHASRRLLHKIGTAIAKLNQHGTVCQMRYRLEEWLSIASGELPESQERDKVVRRQPRHIYQSRYQNTQSQRTYIAASQEQPLLPSLPLGHHIKQS